MCQVFFTVRRRLRLFADLPASLGRLGACLKGTNSDVGLVYPTPGWQDFLSVISRNTTYGPLRAF